MSVDQGGPTWTLWITRIKRHSQLTMEINLYGLHYGPAKIRSMGNLTGRHRSANQNEPFYSRQERSRRRAVCQSLHEGDSQATQTITHYHHQQRDTIHLRPMKRNYKQTRSQKKAQQGFQPANRWTEGTNQSHIGTISPTIAQLSTRPLV